MTKELDCLKQSELVTKRLKTEPPQRDREMLLAMRNLFLYGFKWMDYRFCGFD